MNWRKIVLLLLEFFLFFAFALQVAAQEEFGCENRYLTLINPVRGRNLWLEKSLQPLQDQYGAIKKYGFSATWLLQYDALADKKITAFVKSNFADNQEFGVFLEVSPNLALSARVIYPPLVPWFKPQAVFLSGYSQDERRRLIDTVFRKFKNEFGYYPLSVGAWWLDSYSLEYLKRKYAIKAVLIVADQQTTDNYGIWGQWWGVPYYPSLANVLVPARDSKNKLDVVVLQWAQRDITKAYGAGTSFSNYSLQANDYTERGLTTAYFKQLAGRYLDCRLLIGQITVGLETGIESVKSFAEYQNQLDVLYKIKDLKSVTMTDFSDQYRKVYPSNPSKIVLNDEASEWVLTLEGRENKYLGDKIDYPKSIAFTDYFVSDKSDFLERKLPLEEKRNLFIFPNFFWLAFFLGLIFYWRKKIIKYYLFISLFIFSSFLTTFLAYFKYGRIVFFGPVLHQIFLVRFFLTLVVFFLFAPVLKYLDKKVKNLKLLLLSLSLSFGIDFVVSILRYTQLQSERYLGFTWDALKFIGFKFSPKTLVFINQDLSSLAASSLLKFNFDLIWESKILSFAIYPLFHLVLGVLIYFILNKLPKTLSRIIMAIFVVFFYLYLYRTITSDPRVVF